MVAVAEPDLVITAARVLAANGTVAATVDWVPVGGGSQVKTVDGTAEEHVHPSSVVYHVRFISPDRQIPDELREAATFEEAAALAAKYAAKLDEHAERIAGLAGDLKV